jgi:hypothetical protein
MQRGLIPESEENFLLLSIPFPDRLLYQVIYGFLIGSLTAKGDIDINKPVRIISIKFYNDEMNDRITIRDMLCHRTGLPRHDYSWYLFSTNSRDSLLMRIKYLEPSAHVGEKWQYNNYMYLAQSVLIEKFSHQTWETNITNNIWPCMTHSNLTIDELEKSDAAFDMSRRIPEKPSGCRKRIIIILMRWGLPAPLTAM